jgi:hypothetical protein
MDLTFFLMQALVKHSQDKDQFLKVAIKRMTEAHVLDDELKEVCKHTRSSLFKYKNLKLNWSKRARQKMVTIPSTLNSYN